MTDLEIARSFKLLPIQEIGQRLGFSPEELHPYGRYKGKVSLSSLDRLKSRPQGRYILVTAINPTPLGEGKTTTSIGLAMGLCRIGSRAVVTLRQPSLGPVFGIKGGGTGGGPAQRCIITKCSSDIGRDTCLCAYRPFWKYRTW